MVVALVAIGGCTSDDRHGYRQLASEANPILGELRAFHERLRSMPRTDHAATIAVCRSAEDALRRLQRVRLDEREPSPRGPYSRPSLWIDSLLDPWQRQLACREPASERCSRSCIEDWEYLAASVDELRERARKYDVEIVSLLP